MAKRFTGIYYPAVHFFPLLSLAGLNMRLLNRIYFSCHLPLRHFTFANLSFFIFFLLASRWLAEESLIPPKPEVRIRGTHMIRRRNGDKTETSTTTDFDIRLKLGEYFLEGNVPGYAPYLTTVDGNRRANRGGRWKTVAADPEEVLPVRCWADRYCEDKSILKE